MPRYLASILFFLVLLSGCEQNNDVALLNAYPAFGRCAIETPQNAESISANKDFTISGWAFDAKNISTPDTLTLYLVNDAGSTMFTFPARRGTKREDVAAVFQLPLLVNSGFSSEIKKHSLPAGNYRLVLLQADRSMGVITCSGLNHTIQIQ